MLFNSYEFIFLFLPITFFIYFYLLNKRLVLGAKIFLVLASLFFYSYWNVKYLPLILLSIFVNYSVGLSLVNHHKIRLNPNILLVFGVVFNVALLAYFKYTDFFLENFNGFFGLNIPLPHIILPLGISFFTFTQIAFLVDAYKNEAKEYGLVNYMLFVTYFPHLLAGPILHHKEMMPQFSSKLNWVKNYKNIALGVFIFSIGLFKKVVIADTFGVWANAGFDSANILNFAEAWAASLSYTFQLYFDFSGYTDMAIGISLMFNIKLPINFNSPYKALNIQDFWRRWHMTLSRFLRDYIYIPLGGNRGGVASTYRNLLLTFLIGGLWHGAGWTFIFWGFLHGIALVMHRVWQNLGFKMHKILAWFITFNFINFTWIFFRAKEWEDAIKVLKGMLGMNGIILPSVLVGKLEFLSVFGVEFGAWLTNIRGNVITVVALLSGLIIISFRNSNEIKFRSSIMYLLFSSILFAYSLLSFSKISEFLYFNF
ncbi:MBOAT family O-acyltransferase [Campylobacter hyointestinalis]|uniref:MBOAT family protein n=1 Tax=Campylobacter hyointestinalis subsp. lawsonii TaxID=91353 RepID=A0AAV6EFC5_CAMHY|nr:MBOAT family protein [Campylobacter hyointestinalis]KAB0613642.1 MBOAT family protein [Campylobacter hyointestinalis subsp. lawsonii]QKF68688.1 membrane-bound O-acyl transferase, MBOAT family [Campylobacter hyointestinalis subsp. lawsonii]RAZ28558.1 MBOAT family protein [Campylobacter hyointestinalis subsp. lawsonii]